MAGERLDQVVNRYGAGVAAQAQIDSEALEAPLVPTRRGPRVRLVALVVLIATLAGVGVVVGLVARSAPPTARVCAEDGSACAPLSARATATRTWALLPIDRAGRLRVENRFLTGDLGIGIAAFLDAADRSAVRVLPATTTRGGVLVRGEATKPLPLTGVPDGATVALVRMSGVDPVPDVVAPCVATPAGRCRELRVTARTVDAAPTTADLVPLLRERGFGAAAADKAGAATATVLARRAGTPARLRASVRPGDGRLTVDWVLAPGGENVVAVRVTLRRDATGTSVQTYDAIAVSGSAVMPDLDRRSRYVVEVAPVVQSGQERIAGAPVRLTAVPDGEPARAAATTPSAPEGWKPLLEEDFDRSAPIGTFADRYPSWAWYDGITETARETNRPKSQVGIWDSKTTVRVHDGMLDCRLYTAGVRPQICAITPTPNEDIWHGQMYGRYTVRFKADPVPGYKIAWLLWPDANVWPDGEIDFPEASLDGTITGSSHRNDGDPSEFSYFVDTAQRLGGWHTATIDWRPGRITYLLDGQSWTTTDPAGLPRVPMRWALQAETEIVDSAPDPALQGHILIDWVAAWSWRG